MERKNKFCEMLLEKALQEITTDSKQTSNKNDRARLKLAETNIKNALFYILDNEK